MERLPRSEEVVGAPGAGVTGNCEPPSMGAWKSAWSSARVTYALNSQTICPDPCFIFKMTRHWGGVSLLFWSICPSWQKKVMANTFSCNHLLVHLLWKMPTKVLCSFLRSFFSLIITVELQELIVYLGYWDLIRCVTGEFWSLLRFYEGKNGSNSFSMWRRFFMKKGLPRCCQGQLRSPDQISEVIQSQRY